MSLALGRALLLGGLAAWTACQGNDTCTEPVVQPSGEAYRCATAEGCPRPENAVVCLDDSTPEQPCVACDRSVCRLHTAPPCG